MGPAFSNLLHNLSKYFLPTVAKQLQTAMQPTTFLSFHFCFVLIPCYSFFCLRLFIYRMEEGDLPNQSHIKYKYLVLTLVVRTEMLFLKLHACNVIWLLSPTTLTHASDKTSHSYVQFTNPTHLPVFLSLPTVTLETVEVPVQAFVHPQISLRLLLLLLLPPLPQQLPLLQRLLQQYRKNRTRS